MSTWLLQWRAVWTKSFYSKLKSLVRANQCTAMINCVLWQLRCTVLELWLFAYLKDNSLQFHTMKPDKYNTLYFHIVMLTIFISLLQMNYQLYISVTFRSHNFFISKLLGGDSSYYKLNCCPLLTPFNIILCSLESDVVVIMTLEWSIIMNSSASVLPVLLHVTIIITRLLVRAVLPLWALTVLPLQAFTVTWITVQVEAALVWPLFDCRFCVELSVN